MKSKYYCNILNSITFDFIPFHSVFHHAIIKNNLHILMRLYFFLYRILSEPHKLQFLKYELKQNLYYKFCKLIILKGINNFISTQCTKPFMCMCLCLCCVRARVHIHIYTFCKSDLKTIQFKSIYCNTFHVCMRIPNSRSNTTTRRAHHVTLLIMHKAVTLARQILQTGSSIRAPRENRFLFLLLRYHRNSYKRPFLLRLKIREFVNCCVSLFL